MTGGTKRWKPTTEQREILEHIFKLGIHTPKVKEIERITAVLKRHGEIEAKNVFYWFQNFNSRHRSETKTPTFGESQQRKRALELSHSLSEIDSADTTLSDSKGKQIKRTTDSAIADRGEDRQNFAVTEDLSTCSNTFQTLELFPLRPDRGGLEQQPNTRLVAGDDQKVCSKK